MCPLTASTVACGGSRDRHSDLFVFADTRPGLRKVTKVKNGGKLPPFRNRGLVGSIEVGAGPWGERKVITPAGRTGGPPLTNYKPLNRTIHVAGNSPPWLDLHDGRRLTAGFITGGGQARLFPGGRHRSLPA